MDDELAYQATIELHNLGEIMRSRRTTKLFSEKCVSANLIKEAIEVARWAPNHHLTEPWHFYLLGRRIINELAILIGDIILETKKDSDLSKFKKKSALAIPGWLLVTCKRSDSELLQQEDYASCCCAIQNLSLYLSKADVAMKWTTGLVTRDERLFKLLNIDSDKEFVVGLIWFGYPKILPKQSRKDVSEIMSILD